MRDGEICVCYLQGTLKTNQPKISRHLAYLRKAGLVDARREGKWVHYSLKKQPPELEHILAGTLAAISAQPQIRKDIQRSKQIQCTPAKYGFSAPGSTSR